MEFVKGLLFLAILALVDHSFAQQTTGFDPIARAKEDSKKYWTFVQKDSFPTNGVILGFNIYATNPTPPSRPLILGLYRPVNGSTCKFTLLKFWQPDVTAVNTATKITFSESEKFAFKAGDTIGYSFANYGLIPYDETDKDNYCEAEVFTTVIGEQVSLTDNRYGKRIFSLQAVYGPPTNKVLGFEPLPRKVLDIAAVWTFVQIQGFPTDGVIKGFKVYNHYPTSQRPLTFGLYRPVNVSSCTYTLLKLWQPTITEVNKVTEITLSANEQFAFKAGDTFGHTWTVNGNIPFDFSATYNYCQEARQFTTIGEQVQLSSSIGHRTYSFQAIYSES